MKNLLKRLLKRLTGKSSLYYSRIFFPNIIDYFQDLWIGIVSQLPKIPIMFLAFLYCCWIVIAIVFVLAVALSLIGFGVCLFNNSLLWGTLYWVVLFAIMLFIELNPRKSHSSVA
jgi:hypothetical protein